MNVIIIGGAGYLGSVLVRQLLNRGHEVRVIDNLTYGDSSIADLTSRIDLHVRDMRELAPSDLAGADAVINCGGVSNDPTADWNPQENWAQNFHAVVHTAQSCRAAGVGKFVFASSCCVYDGAAQEVIPFTEDRIVAPVGHYSRAKHAAEIALQNMAGPDLTVAVFRMATLFGPSPRMRFDLVVNNMVRSGLSRGFVEVAGQGTLWRPLLSVRDAARAYVLAVERRLPDSYQVLNLVGENRQLIDIARAVVGEAALCGRLMSIRHGTLPIRVRSYQADGNHARRTLGFRPADSVRSVAGLLIKLLRTWSSEELFAPVQENIRWLTRAWATV